VFFSLNENSIVLEGCSDDFRCGTNVQSLFAKRPIGLLHNVRIHARKNRGHELDNGDLRAEASPHGPELEANNATTYHDEVLWNLSDRKRANVRQDSAFINLQKWKLDRH